MTESYLLSVVCASCVLAGKAPMYNRSSAEFRIRFVQNRRAVTKADEGVRRDMRRLRTDAACEAPSGSTVSKFASRAVVLGRCEFPDSPGVTSYDFTAAWGGRISFLRSAPE